MNILLNGICGHMGQEVVKLCNAGYRGAALAAGVDAFSQGGEAVPVYKRYDEMISAEGIDCIVDFSHHTCIGAIMEFAVANGVPAVIATTGHTEEEKAVIYAAAEKIPVFFSANMSLGVALLVELAKTAAAAMPEAARCSAFPMRRAFTQGASSCISTARIRR